MPDKICRKCVYLLESFHCFKEQLVSADKRLRNVWANEEEENSQGIHDELDYDIEWISDDVRKKVEKAFRRKWVREDKMKLRESRITMKNIEVQVSLPCERAENKIMTVKKSADVIQDDIRQTEEPKDIIENDTVETKGLEDVIKNDIVRSKVPERIINNGTVESDVPKDIVIDDILKPNEPEDIVNGNIFEPYKPQDIKGNSVKIDESKDIENNSVMLEESEDIKDNSLKSKQPKDMDDHFVKSEKTKVSAGDEAIGSQSGDYAVKQELIPTDRLNDAHQAKKSDDGTHSNEVEKKEDTNVIVISDSSDEAETSDLPRGASEATPTDSSGAAGNGAYSITILSPLYPNGRKIITIPRVSAVGKNVTSTEKRKELLSREKTSTNSSPRRFFQCTRCNVNLFTVAAVLLHHNQVHTPNKASLCCRMCDKTFPAKSNLFEHFNQHVESHLFRCSYCSNEFVMKKNLVEHMKIHKKRVAAETKSANKRVRAGSENFTEASLEVKHRAKKSRSPTSPKDSEDSGKENVDAVDSRILIAQNPQRNAVKKSEKENAPANQAARFNEVNDENCMELDEEIIGN